MEIKNFEFKINKEIFTENAWIENPENCIEQTKQLCFELFEKSIDQSLLIGSKSIKLVYGHIKIIYDVENMEIRVEKIDKLQ